MTRSATLMRSCVKLSILAHSCFFASCSGSQNAPTLRSGESARARRRPPHCQKGEGGQAGSRLSMAAASASEAGRRSAGAASAPSSHIFWAFTGAERGAGPCCPPPPPPPPRALIWGGAIPRPPRRRPSPPSSWAAAAAAASALALRQHCPDGQKTRASQHEDSLVESSQWSQQ
ncbi:hypothetical protein GGR56DRAFT_174122 [Xylariaceae sp. FL0804]|nr:hypothetical protein GGR56DRAFT_174122 [Xylariaceae sp. FL0804]